MIARIEIAKMPLEGIDLVEREIALAQRLYAFHDVKKPAARLQRFVPEKQGLLPLLKDFIFRPNDPAFDNMDFAGLGYTIQPDF